jgi:hypothetical protein
MILKSSYSSSKSWWRESMLKPYYMYIWFSICEKINSYLTKNCNFSTDSHHDNLSQCGLLHPKLHQNHFLRESDSMNTKMWLRCLIPTIYHSCTLEII